MKAVPVIGTFAVVVAAWAVQTSEFVHAEGAGESTPTERVVVVRQFAATPQEVWAAWTDPAQMSRWFGSDPQGRVLAAAADVRIGGRYAVTFADSDGTEHTASGQYSVVEPHSRLSFSWHWQSEPGVRSSVTITLTPEGTGTRMRFEHAGIGYGSSHDFERGWQSTFDKLERALRRQS